MRQLGIDYHDRTPAPTILYKYRSLQTARVTLEKSQAVWRCPLDFNDPFDVHWDIMADVRRPENVKRRRELQRLAILDALPWPTEGKPQNRAQMSAFASQLRLMPRLARELIIRQRMEQFEKVTEKAYYWLESAQKELLQGSRVFCASADELSVLMWSHYGDEHRGVCLGLDSALLAADWGAPALKVTYSDNRPLLIKPEDFWRTFMFGCPEPAIRNADVDACFMTKHTRWAYEIEWRWLKDGEPRVPGAILLITIPQQAIRELVFGCRVLEADAREFLAFARACGHSPSVFQTRQLESSNGLSRIPLRL